MEYRIYWFLRLWNSDNIESLAPEMPSYVTMELLFTQQFCYTGDQVWNNFIK
jgi:hypothetical protein